MCGKYLESILYPSFSQPRNNFSECAHASRPWWPNSGRWCRVVTSKRYKEKSRQRVFADWILLWNVMLFLCLLSRLMHTQTHISHINLTCEHVDLIWGSWTVTSMPSWWSFSASLFHPQTLPRSTSSIPILPSTIKRPGWKNIGPFFVSSTVFSGFSVPPGGWWQSFQGSWASQRHNWGGCDGMCKLQWLWFEGFLVFLIKMKLQAALLQTTWSQTVLDIESDLSALENWSSKFQIFASQQASPCFSKAIK